MFKFLFICMAVLCCCHLANAQDIFDANDTLVNYKSTAPAGTAHNPNIPAYGLMNKWIRDTTSSNNLAWDTTSKSKFKCYIWNGLAFRLRYPNNYNPASATKYPMIIFFHGGGEIGPVNNNEKQLVWAAQPFEQRINNGEWNGFMLFPQETAIGWGDFHYSRVNSVLDTLTKYNALDPDRVISMGLSAGGLGAADYANQYPKRIAAALPASPYQITSLNNTISRFVHIPLWLANGGTDINPYPDTVQNFISSFRGAGGNIYQTYLVNDGHTTWTDMWNLRNAAGVYMTTAYWNSAHKAQPLVYFQNQQFCSTGPISARMGITPGYFAYEWQQNGSTIAGATGNEYTATQAGEYRVRFMRDAGGAWSAWTPNPVVVSTKACATDTLFAEHFTNDNVYNSAPPYAIRAFGCQNGIITNSTDLFTQDAGGVQGSRFLYNSTKNDTSTCKYTAGDEVWGTPNAVTVTPNKDYEFSFYIGNQTSTTRAQLAPAINGTPLIAGFAQTTGTGNASWRKFTYTWNSGSATTADLSIINRATIAITTNNGNDFMLDEISFKLATTLRTLPVTWLQVLAKPVGKEVNVSWKIANEVNVNNYVVERSSNGISFTGIATVPASAPSAANKQYAAVDNLPNKGINYYRIRETDLDGRYTYSQIVVANVAENGEAIIWPSPAATTVTVQNAQTMVRLQCFSGSGQLVYDVKPAANQHTIVVQQWPAGIYYMQITSGGQVTQKRFIKQ